MVTPTTITTFEVPVPQNPLAVVGAVRNILNLAGVDVGIADPIKVVSKIFGGDSDRNIQIGGIVQPANLTVDLHGAVVADSFRNAGAILAEDGNEASRVEQIVRKQLEFLGLDEVSQTLGETTNALPFNSPEQANQTTSTRVQLTSNAKSFITSILATPDFKFRGLTGQQIQDDFDRAEVISYNDLKLGGALRTGNAYDINKHLSAIHGARAGSLGILNGAFLVDSPSKWVDTTRALPTDLFPLHLFPAAPAPVDLAELMASQLNDTAPAVQADVTPTITPDDTQPALPVAPVNPINVTVNLPQTTTSGLSTISGNQSTLGTPTGIYNPTQPANPQTKSNWWNKAIKAGQVATGIHTAVTLPITISKLFQSGEAALPFLMGAEGDEFITFPNNENQTPLLFTTNNLPANSGGFTIEELAEMQANGDQPGGGILSIAPYILMGLLVAYVSTRKRN
jgi:hypothetical protein